MADKTIKVRYEAATAQYQASMAKMSATTREFSREITGAGNATDQHLKRISRGALVASGAIAVGLGLSAKAAVDWESSWAGVTKTVDGSKEQLAGLQSGLRDMASELPATHGEIAAVAEAAGQLGVKVGDIESFTRVMVDLGETTNLTADEAATSLARISNIMGTSGADIERMGSTIVELGNNSATTEAEIVELGTRLAAAGKIAGLSEADVFAFASTLTSVGVEAEAGGTALSKVFTSIRDAVLDGSENLDTFAEVAGVTADDFSTAFRDDASGAIAMFIEGLGRMNDSGQSTTGVFKELELTDQRLMRALLSTASAGDLLTDQLGMSSAAWEENTALQTEAEKRYATTAAQVEILRNKAVDLGIDLGGVLLPALNGGVEITGDMIDAFSQLPGPMQTSAVALAAVAAAGLGVVGAMGTIGPKVREGREALSSMGEAGKFANQQLGRIGRFALRAGAYAAAFVIIGQSLSKMTDVGQPENLTAWREELEILARTGAGFDFGEIVTALDEIADPSIGENIGSTTSRVVGFVGAFAGIEGTAERNENRIREFDQVLSDMVSGGQVDLAATAFEHLKTAADDQGIALGEVESAFPGYTRALELAGAKAADGEGAVDELTDGLSEQEQQIQETVDAWSDLADALSAQFDPLFAAQDATLNLAEAQQAAADAAAEFGADSMEAAAANREVVRAALENEQAQIELRAAIESGSVSVDDARATMQGWVDQGIITQAQADRNIAEFELLAASANAIPDVVRINVQANTSAALQRLNELDARARAVGRNVLLNSSIAARERYGAATGGLVPQHLAAGGSVAYLAAGGGSLFRPMGTDTVPAMLTPGEFVQQKSAVDKYGVGFMQSVNEGSFVANEYTGIRSGGFGGGGGTTVINRYAIHASSISATEVAHTVRDAIETIRRDGI